MWRNGENVNVVWNQDEKWNYLEHDHEKTELDAIQKKKWARNEREENEKNVNEKGTDLSSSSSVHRILKIWFSFVWFVYASSRRNRATNAQCARRKLLSKLICINSWRSHMNKIKCLRVWHLQSQSSPRRCGCGAVWWQWWNNGTGSLQWRCRQDIFHHSFASKWIARISSITHNEVILKFYRFLSTETIQSENPSKIIFVVPSRDAISPSPQHSIAHCTCTHTHTLQ